MVDEGARRGFSRRAFLFHVVARRESTVVSLESNANQQATGKRALTLTEAV